MQMCLKFRTIFRLLSTQFSIYDPSLQLVDIWQNASYRIKRSACVDITFRRIEKLRGCIIRNSCRKKHQCKENKMQIFSEKTFPPNENTCPEIECFAIRKWHNPCETSWCPRLQRGFPTIPWNADGFSLSNQKVWFYSFYVPIFMTEPFVEMTVINLYMCH